MVETVSNHTHTQESDDNSYEGDSQHEEQNPEMTNDPVTVAEDAAGGLEPGKVDLGELTAISEEFNSAFNAALYELESSRRLISERSARIDELNESIESLGSRLEEETGNSRRREEEYAQEKAALTGSLEELQRTHEATCNELESLKNELEHRKNELAEFRGRVEELSAELDSVRQAGERREFEQREEIEKLGAEVRQLNETLQDRENRSREREEELVARADKLQGLNRTLHESAISESDMFTRKLEEKQQEIDSLRSQLDASGDASAGMALAGEETVRLQTALQELESRFRETEGQCQMLDKRARAAEELEAEVERLNRALQEAGESGNDPEVLNAALEDVSRLEAEVERLTADLNEARSAGSDGETGSDEVESLRQQLAELESALESTRAERDHMGEKLGEHEALEQEVASLRQTVEESEGRLREVADSSAGNDALQNEVEQLKSALEAAEERCEQLETVQKDSLAPSDDHEQGMSLSLESVDEPAEAAIETMDREQFLMQLNKLLAEPRDQENGSTVMYVLVDNFVRIRDEIGIMNSEQVISTVSDMIKTHCEGNTVTRFGDCSFAVLCENENKDETRGKAEKIRVGIESHIFEVAGQSLITTTSIGICTVRNSDDDAEKVVDRADLACESARTSGGNQVLVSSAVADDLDVQSRNDGHAELVSKILDEDRIKIYYQPISSLLEKESHCYEVLTRIIDEDGNIILPGEFFSMAINSGMAMDVDLHVINNIMRMMSENPDQPMTLFLKLTRQTVASQDFAVWLMEKVRDYRIDPQKLVFEVAEGLLQNELKNLSMLSKALNSIGCKLAIEHYRMDTQPQHLQHIQADYLKIDSGLVQNISNKGKCFTKVAEIMEVARSNNFITIAEGVESPACLAILWELGVSLAQGYFIQAPAGDMAFSEEGSEEQATDDDGNKATFAVS